MDLQGPNGHWGGAAFVPRAWISTKDTLQLLRDLGVDPTSDSVRRAIAQVRDRCTWGEGFGNSPFFEGEVEPCINGRVLAIGAYFGEASARLVERLLQEQLEDGGWNCDAPPSHSSSRPVSTRSSFHSTICVLEGLLEYETANKSGITRPASTGRSSAARRPRCCVSRSPMARSWPRDLPSDDMIPSLVALSDVMGTGWFAADAAMVKPGATVAVVGDGAVGLLGVLSAK
jgi:hypothetical protein